jgi:surface antigen/LysM repeat protein
VKLLHIFRNYSSFVVVASSALLVSATNLSAGQNSSGFLFGYLETSPDNYASPLEDKMFLNANKKTSLALAPLSEALNIPNPTLKQGDAEPDPMLIQDNALVCENSPVLKDPEEDGGVIIYEVKEGDTMGSIAQANNVTINTLLWANAIDDVNSIMPGDKIFILPVSGLAYTVKSGDDIDSIAKEFKADKDKIIAFNSLHLDGELKVGETITIPDGQKEIPKPKPTESSVGIAQRPYESFESAGKTLGTGGTGHKFPYGYCTWYVAQKRTIPWGGNAGTWLYHAKAAGYATGKTPTVGSIMVSSESWWGHVALVISVDKDTFTVSEMNYKGWAKKSTRVVAKNSRVIKGFIR